jgi:hypothetical protein
MKFNRLHPHVAAFVVLATTLALQQGVLAQNPNISAVLDIPNSNTWNSYCSIFGTPSAPSGASQISDCTANPGACNVWRTTIDNNTFPKAICADGSPGVFYVRPGFGDDINKWVIHLQGGGRCSNHDECLERWCGMQGNLPYTANKMSTDWDGNGNIDVPVRGNAPGMADDRVDNPFGRWNHVWMYYCSSDTWMGRANEVDYTGPAGQLNFSVNYRGHTILSAARRMLRKNSANPAWTSDNGTFNDEPVDPVTMPDLDDASDILFTGTSGGGNGAVHNVDWFMTPLSATTKRLVVDATMEISDSVSASHNVWMDLDLDGTGDLPHLSHRINEQLDSWSSGWFNDINAFVDQSCRDYYQPLDRLDRCSLKIMALTLGLNADPLVETESFVRLDLEDGSVSKRWTQEWPTGGRLLIGGSSGRETTRDDFTVTMRETLVDLYNGSNSNVTGIFAPRCAKHVGLESQQAYADHLTPNSSPLIGGWTAAWGTEQSFRDTLWDWYTQGPRRYIDTGDVGDPTVTSDPFTDPAGQFSSGPGCQY